MIDCGPILKEIRHHKRLSQLDLANLCDCSAGLIAKLEQGVIKSPSLDFVTMLVDKLGVNINVFVRTGEPLFLSPAKPGHDPYKKKLMKYESLIKKLYNEMNVDL